MHIYVYTKKIYNRNVIVYRSIIGESFKLHCPCVKDRNFYCIPTNSSYSVMNKKIVYNYVMWYCITGSTICK